MQSFAGTLNCNLGLIDDLFDLTAITHGKMRLKHEPVSLHDVLATVRNICTSEILKKQLDVSWQLDATHETVIGDGGRLSQVYWNLIRNAVKFTPADGRLSVRSHNPHHGQVVIEISDSGIGIDSDTIQHIFDAFNQGEVRVATEFGGLGLGLAIAKAIIDLHGGTIVAKSDGFSRGSTFTIAIPTAMAGTVSQRDVTHATGNSRRLHILVVDDHEDTAEVLRRLLRVAGHSAKTANSAAAALALAANEKFDLLISDIGLPDASGLDLMRQLHQQYGLSGIALSGYGRDEDLGASKEAGFVEHLTKPVGMSQLQKALQSITV